MTQNHGAWASPSTEREPITCELSSKLNVISLHLASQHIHRNPNPAGGFASGVVFKKKILIRFLGVCFTPKLGRCVYYV
ncbi:uncharacterized protein H6S33_010823 [Morchella sextelata]|uniref:uncharacterized protein n=1 Tax=Morchella sextelata TaxID=1174677 RepID=UPI001D0464AB|nr:uncharacterized protein H6S33_010823 [Morchella sextelata]KAH0611558.1 hypothetical protein H6S33_010823 [Morchella sextelata]